MNKTELAEEVAVQCDISRAAAHRAVDAVFENIVKALKKGDTVQLVGFGSFKVVERAARNALNPITGEPIKVPAKRVPKFIAGKNLKDVVK